LSPSLEAGALHAAATATVVLAGGLWLTTWLLHDHPGLGSGRAQSVILWAVDAAALVGALTAALWRLVVTRGRKFGFLRGGLSALAAGGLATAAVMAAGYLAAGRPSLLPPYEGASGFLGIAFTLILFSTPLFALLAFAGGGVLAMSQGSPAQREVLHGMLARQRDYYLTGRQMAWALVCAVIVSALCYLLTGSRPVAFSSLGTPLVAAKFSPRERETRLGRLRTTILIGAVHVALVFIDRYVFGGRT
jgi:hypothetical protein